MSDYNLFARPQYKGRHKTGKRKPIKANTIMRVGGRKVSAAKPNKDKYNFPVIVTYKQKEGEQ